MSSDEVTSPLIICASSVGENPLDDATNDALQQAQQEIKALKRELRRVQHDLNNMK